MPSSLKLKKKPITLSKATSDSQLPRAFISTQKLVFSSRAELEHSDHGKDLLHTLRSPHKANHYLNLQIPSLSHSNTAKSMVKSKILTSKTIKSPRTTSLKKKKHPESEPFRTPVEDTDEHKNEKIALNDVSEEAKFLERELQKALDENKRLKTKVGSGKVSEEFIDDLMVRFKNRLQKILYEA